MNSKSKKIMYPLLGTLLIAAVATPVIVISMKKSNSKTINNVDWEKDKKQLGSEIFPDISANDYYQYIKIDNDNLPYFEKDIVPAVVKDVLKNLAEYDKNVNFNYKFISVRDLILDFEIKFGSKISQKRYQLNIVKDNDYHKLIVS
ncbi:MHO_1590 family protein [Mycoplasmopsis primatum]|uniref:MHO_1590 family protein n=1 Tax=Mycoplasmopsis primatum TaxID=55604 RepID=UPI0004979101|nr:hypothetical protein [Mycoplasmopsis primatum]